MCQVTAWLTGMSRVLPALLQELQALYFSTHSSPGRGRYHYAPFMRCREDWRLVPPHPALTSAGPADVPCGLGPVGWSRTPEPQIPSVGERERHAALAGDSLVWPICPQSGASRPVGEESTMGFWGSGGFSRPSCLCQEAGRGEGVRK